MNQLQKICTLALLSLAITGTARAQTNLHVSFNDGSSIQSFVLTNGSTLQFDSGNLKLNLEGSKSSIPLTKIANLKFGSVPLGVSRLVNQRQISISVEGERLHVDGPVGGGAAIYGISGQVVWSDRNWQGGNINIAGLPQGLYILRLSNQTFKFNKQ